MGTRNVQCRTMLYRDVRSNYVYGILMDNHLSSEIVCLELGNYNFTRSWLPPLSLLF